ncbi:translocation/assembly module TamB [Chryseobacterium sp. T1]
MAKLENKKNTNETNPEKTDLIDKKHKKSSLWVRIPLYFILSILGLLFLIFITLNLPVTKKYIADKAIEFLNKDLNMGLKVDDIEINFFGDVVLKGVHIKDYKNFEFITAKELQANSDWFALAFNTNDLKFNKAKIVDPSFKVITYKGDSISNFIRFIDNFDDGKPRNPKKKPFQMKMFVDIINGKASIVNENHPGEEGRWLDAHDINIRSQEIKVVGPNVTADIGNFSFVTKRWGKEHIVDAFSTKFEITKKHLKLEDLVFHTDHSLLMGHAILNLDHKTGFGDFSNKVNWDVDFKQGSFFSGYDLSYFMPTWDNYKPMSMSGAMTGPLNKMALNNFQVKAQDINLHAKKLKIADVLKGQFLIESEQLDADFTYKALKAVLPSFIAKNLGNVADDFGRLKYKGAVRAQPKEIFAHGEAITGIGQAKINQFYLTDYSTKLPKYKGYFDVKDLNITAFTKNKQVGLITGKFNVEGQSFDLNTMHLRTKSEIQRIQLLGNDIANVVLDGTLDRKQYKGLVNINDPNAKAKINGLVDFSTSRLKADITADLQYVNLKHFGVSAGGMNSVSGFVSGKFAMTNLNDLDLDANLKELTLTSDDQKLILPNSDIKAFFENGNRVVSVNSPGAVTGQMAGKFNIEDLGKMFSNSINKIMVGNPPKKTYSGQYFNFDFDIRQGLVAFFVPHLKIPNGAIVSGNYQGSTNDLILNADAPYIKYIMTKEKELSEAEKFLADTDEHYKPDMQKSIDSAMVDSLMIRVNTANLEQQVLANIKRGEYSKNVLRDVSIKANNDNGQVLHVKTGFQLGSLDEEKANKLKDYAINLNQTTNSQGDYILRFEPTQVKINNMAWSIDTSAELDHSITYRQKEKDFVVHNLKVFSDDSALLIKSATFKSAKDFEADAEVTNFDISKLIALTSSSDSQDNMQLKGIANGNIQIVMNEKNLEPLVNLEVKDIEMNGEKMGDLVINATKSSRANVFDIDIKALSSELLGGNKLHVSGTIDNNTKSPTLDMNAEMSDFDLRFVQEFVKSIFGNFRGKATGDLKIAGTFADLDYSGDIGLKGFGLKLLFTGVDYSFADTIISLSKGQALLNGIEVSDGRANSKGRVSGSIQFETLSSMAINLLLESTNLMVLNSTQEDNDLFWGKVYGKGDLYVSGPVSGLEISTPNMQALTNSVFTFNSNSTSNVEEFKMLRFLQRDETGLITVEEKKQHGANMIVDFNLKLDKGTTVNVLVGDGIGDINVRGDSDNLKFRMERNGNVSMNGTYIVDSGIFESKAILSRKFQITRGSGIRWGGNPMTPDLGIAATYSRTVSNAGDYLGMTLQPINVLLGIKISQTLTNPKIEFDVTAPDVSAQVRETLATKMSNEDEKVIQFGSILALNTFNVTSAGGLDINLGKTGESIGYGMLFKQLGSVLNTISSEFQVDLDYITGDVGSNTSDRANTSVSFAVSPRVKIKTGLGIPISKNDATSQNYLSGEGIIEYDWSKANNGSRLLRAYSKPSNLGLGVTSAGANQSYGVGVVYSKSFNSFKSLFGKRNNSQKIKEDKKKIIKDSLKNDSVK